MFLNLNNLYKFITNGSKCLVSFEMLLTVSYSNLCAHNAAEMMPIHISTFMIVIFHSAQLETIYAKELCFLMISVVNRMPVRKKIVVIKRYGNTGFFKHKRNWFIKIMFIVCDCQLLWHSIWSHGGQTSWGLMHGDVSSL